MKMNKTEAINAIKEVTGQITQVANSGLNSSEHIRWLFNCRSILEKVFGKNSTYYRSFASLKWRDNSSFVVTIFENADAVKDERDYRFFIKCLEISQGIFFAAIDEIEKSDDMEDLYKDKMEEDSNLFIKLQNIIISKFRVTFRDEPKNEKEVQDKFEDLLIISGFNYTREKDRVIYSTKTYIPDFVLGELNMAAEIKICNRETREKEIITEINDDILAYNTKYKNSIFIIYDIGNIRDVEQFKSSFQAHENIVIIIIKH